MALLVTLVSLVGYLMHFATTNWSMDVASYGLGSIYLICASLGLKGNRGDRGEQGEAGISVRTTETVSSSRAESKCCIS